MKQAIVILFLLVSNNSFSQWKHIWNFVDSSSGINQTITNVYFLNESGPPRVGFVATANLWKTTDAGASWINVTPNNLFEVSDIYFSDSMTGWISGLSYQGSCVYRTSDGGNNWFLLPSSLSPRIINGIHFCRSSKRLFVNQGDSLRYSEDSGATWKTSLVFPASYFSFFSDSVGIAYAYLGPPQASYDSNGGIIRTSDGGVTWDTVHTHFQCIQPLAIPGTSICFAAAYNRIRVYRSDDYGKTWNQLIDFGPNQDSQTVETGPAGSGYISGNLSRLYIASDSGMFVSTDSGKTWFNDGGPTDIGSGYANEFYADKGFTIAGQWLTSGGVEHSGGLWEEIWPTSGVAEETPPFTTILSARLEGNPTAEDGLLWLSIGREAWVNIGVYDVLGRVVPGSGYGGVFEQGTREVPLGMSGAHQGTYYIRIQTANNETRTLKLLKQ